MKSIGKNKKEPKTIINSLTFILAIIWECCWRITLSNTQHKYYQWHQKLCHPYIVLELYYLCYHLCLPRCNPIHSFYNYV